MLGLWELIGIIMFSLWSIMMSAMSFAGAGMLWTMVEEREKGAATEGKLGEAFDIIQAIKFFTLCMVVGFTSVIGAFSLGDTAPQLLTWFDEYADDTKSEGQDKRSLELDPNGTAAMYDIIYHYMTLIMGYMLFSVIAFGGHVFGFMFMDYTELEECNMDLLDQGKKDEILKIFKTFTTKKLCYENIEALMKLADVNHDNNIGRCEDANLMRVLAPSNSIEYAKKYSHNQPLITGPNRCDELFNPLF